METSTKLTNRLEDVDVVASHKVLCKIDNGGHQTSLKEREREKGGIEVREVKGREVRGRDREGERGRDR